MTDKNLTEVVAVIDRSGSMTGLTEETIGGFNNFVEEQKKTQGKCKLTLVQFDDKYQIDYDGVDVNDVKPLNRETYVPRGYTALFDAVGKTVNSVGERLAKTPEEERPGQVIFLIITDGCENSSKEFVGEKVREMVKHQTDKYSWSFVYMGGGDLEHQGRSLGVTSANVYQYSANSVGTKSVYASVGAAVSRRREEFTRGVLHDADDALLSKDEKDALITEK